MHRWHCTVQSTIEEHLRFHVRGATIRSGVLLVGFYNMDAAGMLCALHILHVFYFHKLGSVTHPSAFTGRNLRGKRRLCALVFSLAVNIARTMQVQLYASFAGKQPGGWGTSSHPAGAYRMQPSLCKYTT